MAQTVLTDDLRRFSKERIIMTLKELMSDVARLGFENEISDTELFVSSVNRALTLLYTDRPVTRTVNTFVESSTPLTLVNIYSHRGGSEDSFKLRGKAFSFISSGRCEFRITSGFRTTEHKLFSDMKEYQGFIDGDSDITFTGDYSYTVFSLASFEDLRSDDPRDIPIYGRCKEINLSYNFGDFMSFTDLPKDAHGNDIQGVILKEGSIILPLGYKGEVSINYRRIPTTFLAYSENSPVDVPKETEALLPLLTASFMWLDDDPDKAQYYMALYREGISGVKRYFNKELHNKYTTNGWA